MITVAIVDDEQHVQDCLRLILETYCPEVTLVGIAGTFDGALDLIHEHRPNLLFLDIEMPTGNGIDLAHRFNTRETRVVFVSAHLDRGVETYQVQALDYLSKPIRIAEVQAAVGKCREAMRIQAIASASLKPVKPGTWEDQFVVSEVEGYRFIPLDQIQHVQASRNYSKMYLHGGESLLLSLSIKEVEAMLPRPRFLRTHRSHIVHRPYVTMIARNHHGEIVLRDGTRLPVSRDYVEDIRVHWLRQVR